MTFNELKNKLDHYKPCRASWRNAEKLANMGLCTAHGTVWRFKGTNGRYYEVVVTPRRNMALLDLNGHRLSTLEKWCGDSVGCPCDSLQDRRKK